MFATFTITPNELVRLASVENREVLSNVVRVLERRKASLLPPDYRGEWIKHLEGLLKRCSRGDGTSVSPKRIVRLLREAGPVHLATGRWDADLEDENQWWDEIEAGHRMLPHDVIAGDSGTPCPPTLQSVGCVRPAREAATELALIEQMKHIDSRLDLLFDELRGIIRLHDLVVIENRYAFPGHHREFPHVLEILLDALLSSDSSVTRVVICAVDKEGDGSDWKGRLVGRLRDEIRKRDHGEPLRKLDIEIRRWPGGIPGRAQTVSHNRRIYLGSWDDRRQRFKFRRGIKIDHPSGDNVVERPGDLTLLAALPARDVTSGRSRLDLDQRGLAKQRVETDLVATSDLK